MSKTRDLNDLLRLKQAQGSTYGITLEIALLESTHLWSGEEAEDFTSSPLFPHCGISPVNCCNLSGALYRKVVFLFDDSRYHT